jgi:hypothetical protein
MRVTIAAAGLSLLLIASVGAIAQEGIPSRQGYSAGPAQSGVRRFQPPMANGAVVDQCETWATNCGKGGADRFCQTQGYAAATAWELNRPGRTWVIGSNQFCDGAGCGGFSYIDCAGQSPQQGSDVRRFQPPMANGLTVDNCATWGENCGQPGADQFCRTQGYARAAAWDLNRPGRTWVIGSNRVCDGGGCVGFSYVDCTGRTAQPPSGIRRFQPPMANGLTVDNCATWGENCGQPGADQFCRTQGYARATAWDLNRPGRTWVIGSNRVCDGGGCVGFSYVDCATTQGQPPAQQQPGVVGCFRDQGDPSGLRGRDLDGAISHSAQMTGARCVSECANRGFAYAGTQYGSYCFCGNSYGRFGAANNCDSRCAGNNSEICGGGWANTVYSTGAGSRAKPGGNACEEGCLRECRGRGFHSGSYNGGLCLLGVPAAGACTCR